MANQLFINGVMSSINKKFIERGLVGKIEEAELIFSKTGLSKLESQLSELLLQSRRVWEDMIKCPGSAYDNSHGFSKKEIAVDFNMWIESMS